MELGSLFGTPGIREEAPNTRRFPVPSRFETAQPSAPVVRLQRGLSSRKPTYEFEPLGLAEGANALRRA